MKIIKADNGFFLKSDSGHTVHETGYYSNGYSGLISILYKVANWSELTPEKHSGNRLIVKVIGEKRGELAVEQFAEEMVEKLELRKDRESWKMLSDNKLLAALKAEVAELEHALNESPDREEIRRECIDIANYAMFIWDKLV